MMQYFWLLIYLRVDAVGSNEGPDSWGVDTEPKDMGSGQLGILLAAEEGPLLRPKIVGLQGVRQVGIHSKQCFN